MSLARLFDVRPRVLLTLGSGLGALAARVAEPVAATFAELGLPDVSVAGHAGRLVAGHLAGVPVVVQEGRVHLYEGRGPRDVTAVVRAAADAGVEAFVVTNAAGGLHPDMARGDLMLIADQLNLTGTSPLVGLPEPQFVDMGHAYDTQLGEAAHAAARAAGQELRDGVYAGVVGPAYETPAEARMLRGLGADAVGMSTVLEVIAARAAGLRVAGLSLITNVHSGQVAVSHEEVLAAGAAGGRRLADVVLGLLTAVGRSTTGAPPGGNVQNRQYEP